MVTAVRLVAGKVRFDSGLSVDLVCADPQIIAAAICLDLMF